MSSQSTPLPNHRVFSQEIPPKCKAEQPPGRAHGNICGNDNTVTSRTLSCKYTHAHRERRQCKVTHCGTICNSRRLGATQMSISRELVQWIMKHLHSVVVKKWRNHLYADLEPSLRHTVKWKEQGVGEVVNRKVKEYINTLSHKCIKMSGRPHKEMIALVQ